MQTGTRMVDDKGINMVYVPAGSFLMGSREVDVEAAYQEAVAEAPRGAADVNRDGYATAPQHSAAIEKPFWLDLTPVTNESYAQFKQEGGYATREFWTEAGWEWSRSGQAWLPKAYPAVSAPHYPRVGVTWHEAYAYCRWRGGRLPTEAEWEWALRGAENRIYPWGDAFDGDRVTLKDGFNTLPLEVGEVVRTTGASWVGALDMVGNIAEWMNTIYQPYPYSESDGREAVEDKKGERVRRGWNRWATRSNAQISAVNNLCSTLRYGAKPKTQDAATGFRCVRSA
jgi:formylglycine-generating enzyme required for sulfatase activity